jgi:hypothetical protein
MVSSLQSTSSLRKIADADSCKLRKWYIQISAYIFYLSDFQLGCGHGLPGIFAGLKVYMSVLPLAC